MVVYKGQSRSHTLCLFKFNNLSFSLAAMSGQCLVFGPSLLFIHNLSSSVVFCFVCNYFCLAQFVVCLNVASSRTAAYLLYSRERELRNA